MQTCYPAERGDRLRPGTIEGAGGATTNRCSNGYDFTDWVRDITQRLVPGGAALGPEMTLVERVAEWPKQWLREGREQGVREGFEQGLEQGLSHERALLRRQAASRFGTDTATRLSEMLVAIADADSLAEIGDWLVCCDTDDEFLARVAASRNEGFRTDT